MRVMNFRMSVMCGLTVALSSLGEAAAQSRGDWPRYSYNYANTNANVDERGIAYQNAPTLRRAWETFNDSAWRPAPPPTGFVLEAALGLQFPSSVVGVVAPPILANGTIYYIDALGTLFARDAQTGGITDPARHWTTTLVDPDYAAQSPPISPELYYSAPVAVGEYLWIHSSFNGRLHAVRRRGGREIDFDASRPGVQPFAVLPDNVLASSLGEPVAVSARVQLNGIPAKYVSVEAVYSSANGAHGDHTAPEQLHVQRLELVDSSGNVHSYAGQIEAVDSGRFALGVRVRPQHEVMLHPFETGLCTWAD